MDVCLSLCVCTWFCVLLCVCACTSTRVCSAPCTCMWWVCVQACIHPIMHMGVYIGIRTNSHTPVCLYVHLQTYHTYHAVHGYSYLHLFTRAFLPSFLCVRVCVHRWTTEARTTPGACASTCRSTSPRTPGSESRVGVWLSVSEAVAVSCGCV